jgi:hypothetical protein
VIGIADIETMDRAALLAAWPEHFDAPAPKGLSRTFLRRFLAFEIQARRQGGLPKRVTAALRRDEKAARRSATPTLRPGGRLLREWNGVTHVVEVTAEGYLWNNERYRSLSAVAREITGAHWSGPRFFGLKGSVSR